MPYEILDDEPAGRYELLPAEAAGTGSAALDAGNALGTGGNRGLLRLAGLPVDTVANVLDLGRAALGAPITAITGRTPKMLEVPDRKTIVGSGDYLIDKARQAGATRALIDPVNPEYEGGYTQAAGGALAGVVAPSSWAQAANQALLSLGGVLGGKAAYDATGNPALAITAGMLPAAGQQALIGAAQYGVRGGEKGRQEMAQRVQDLKNAGVDEPTLGLASGNKLIGGVENLLQSTPGAIGIMGKSRDKAVEGLQRKADRIAALASPDRMGAVEAGQALEKGIRGFRDQMKDRQGELYDRMDASIAPQTPVDVTGTRSMLSNLNASIPGAPNLSKQFRNSRIQSIEDAIQADTAPGRSGLLGTGSMNQLPFEALKKTRTLVGGEIADNTIASDVPRSKWNPLYGALTEDMRAAASASGPAATKSFNQATDYTRSALDRLDRIAPFAQASAPEQNFRAFAQSAKENTSTLQAVKKSLGEDARGTLAGTIIERLGKARNGVQNDTGTAWSPETFLTNWNAMSPGSRAELFSGFKNAAEVRTTIENVARATSMMRESSRMWANPSGTSANVAARSLLASVPAAGAAAAGGLINPLVPAGIGAGLLSTRMAAGALTSPSVVRAAAQPYYVSPGLLGAQAGSLIGGGLLSYPND